MWAGRTVALLHCRTACTAEPANVRTFPSLSARSLDMCAHFLPRHLAKAGPFVRTFGRVRKVRTFFGCVRGDLQHPAKCAHKSRDGRLRGREMCAHSPWFSGATVQQCDGATRKRPWRTEQRSAGWEAALSLMLSQRRGSCASFYYCNNNNNNNKPPRSPVDRILGQPSRSSLLY